MEEKIKDIAKQGQINNVRQMQSFIKNFVRESIFGGIEPPPFLHRRYFPLDSDVDNIIRSVMDVADHSTDDQLNLQVRLVSRPYDM